MTRNKLLTVIVHGNNGAEYSFNFYGDPQFLQEWRDNGLEVYEITERPRSWVRSFFRDFFGLDQG